MEYSHEPNEPPRIHIGKDNSSAKFWLKQVDLANNIGFTKKELTELDKSVTKHQKLFLDKWNEYFSYKN